MKLLFAKAVSFLSFLGIIDAGYITVKAFSGGSVVCPLTGGCDAVLQSPYAQILGLPVALYGLFFYLTLFLVSFMYFDRRSDTVLKALLLLPVVGFLFTLWFFYLQAFVIEAYCFYCLISAGLSTLLLISSALTYYAIRSSAEKIEK